MQVKLAAAAVPPVCTLIADAMPVVLGLCKVLPVSTPVECYLHMKGSFPCCRGYGKYALEELLVKGLTAPSEQPRGCFLQICKAHTFVCMNFS